MFEFFTSPMCFSLIEFVMLYVGVQLFGEAVAFISTKFNNAYFKYKSKINRK